MLERFRHSGGSFHMTADDRDEAAKLICLAQLGKRWEDTTEAERKKCRKLASEMREILSPPWPTHLPAKSLH